MVKNFTIKIIIMISIIFIMSNIFNFSFAVTNIEGTVGEDYGRNLYTGPVKGVRVTLKNKETNSTISTISDEEGKFIFYDVNPGEYSIQYKYGDLTVLNEFPNANLSEEDILKYNGQDYIASYMNGVTESLAEQVIPQLDKTAAQVFLILDTSGSMRAKVGEKNITAEPEDTGDLKGTRLEQVQEASKILVDKIIATDENIYVGLIEFNTNTQLLKNLCRDTEALKESIDSLTPRGGTYPSKALNLAKNSFANTEAAKIIIFLSDGMPASKDDVKAEIASVRNAGIELFSLIIGDDVENERINEIFAESPTGSTVLKIKNSGDELAECLADYIPSWIINKVEEIREAVENSETTLIESDDLNTQTGIEDKDRRNEVDSYFAKTFHYNCELKSNEPYNLCRKTSIFKSIDNASDFSKQDKSDFSNHTYITLTYDNIVVSEDTTISNLNVKLKRRAPFLMEISTKAVALKVILSDGTVLVKQLSDSDDFELFYTCLDYDIIHGSTISIEYEVTVKNNSNAIACTQLELLSYMPTGLMLSNNQKLITDENVTNIMNGWIADNNKELLHDDGYISDSLYKDKDLMSRSIARFSSDSTNGICIKPNSEFKTHYVASAVVGSLDDIDLKYSSATEILGYANTGFRRMEYLQDSLGSSANSTEETINAGQKVYFKSLYPGDGKKDDVDYAKDSNVELVVPPTGKKGYYTTILVFLSTITIIYISRRIFIKK